MSKSPANLPASAGSSPESGIVMVGSSGSVAATGGAGLAHPRRAGAGIRALAAVVNYVLDAAQSPSTAARPVVDLNFSFGHTPAEQLGVRVEFRGGVVQTTFRTASTPNCRGALDRRVARCRSLARDFRLGRADR